MFQILVFFLCAWQISGDAEVNKWFEVSALIPDVIDKAPEDYMKVSYNGKEMDLGDLKTIEEVENEPKVWWDSEPDHLYTLIMVDPDATSRRNPTMREWRHWMVINIPGTRVGKGDVVTKYEGAEPPAGSGRHRYAIFAYRQKSRMNPKKIGITNKNRAKFHTHEFIKKHDYHHSHPCAGNYFRVEAQL